MTQSTSSITDFSRTVFRVGRRRTAMYFMLCAGIASFAVHDGAPGPLSNLAIDSTAGASFLSREISSVFARFDAKMLKLQRAQTVTAFARRYAVNSRLALDIHDAAERAGIDPDLAFRLVKLESDFDEQATSPVGAIGLTQLMLATAQEYDESLTSEMLYERQLNLRLGFRYLRDMLEEHDGHIMLALAAYNRGPGTVSKLLAQGQVPSNAYERVIMRGYTGRGILE